MIHITSDTHFGHKNIIEYCNRPFKDVDDMNACLIRNWNEVVSPDDTVWHLGDFAMGDKSLWPSYRTQLNGTIVFWQGNHDAPDTKFRAALDSRDVVNQETLEHFNGYKLWIAHVPVGGDQRINVNRETKPHYSLALCGHVHDSWTYNTRIRCLNVGVDVWNYTPIPLTKVLDYIN